MLGCYRRRCVVAKLNVEVNREGEESGAVIKYRVSNQPMEQRESRTTAAEKRQTHTAQKGRPVFNHQSRCLHQESQAAHSVNFLIGVSSSLRNLTSEPSAWSAICPFDAVHWVEDKPRQNNDLCGRPFDANQETPKRARCAPPKSVNCRCA